MLENGVAGLQNVAAGEGSGGARESTSRAASTRSSTSSASSGSPTTTWRSATSPTPADLPASPQGGLPLPQEVRRRAR
ncbi:hypothetical protein [Nesterenkonia pannonica]|uniref:hypothetical protein n=1 Tax=Nesterenkonia pannonica TaxID=1548602 RepID=UPI00216404AC|nr:hypothetical protein [Nesterenkonia pannonica]